MKVGSLVEVVKDLNWINKLPGYDEIIPQKNIIYTVRGMIEIENRVGIILEEIINKPTFFTEGVNEVHFPLDHFKEIQPPMDISEIVKQCQTVELYATI